MIAPLTLAFNYSVTPGKNDYGPLYTVRITPDNGNGNIFKPGYAREAQCAATTPVEESLSFAAFSFLEYARHRHPDKVFSNDVVFIDPQGRKQTITAAAYTPARRKEKARTKTAPSLKNL